MAQPHRRPLLRYLPDPCDARVLHRRVGIEAASDSAGDESGALLLQEGDEALFGGDEGVEADGLTVEEGDDGPLLGKGWEADPLIQIGIGIEILDTSILLDGARIHSQGV